MSEDRVSITITDGIADVRMTRADKRNALDNAMFAALAAAGERLKTEPGVRVVVLSGEGSSFCAGLDFATMSALAGGGERAADRPAEGNPGEMKDGRITHLGQQVCWVWQEVPVPVIAAVHGHALGGGIQIALGADIRIVHPDTQMSVREIHWGLVPDMTGTMMLSQLVRLQDREHIESMLTNVVAAGAYSGGGYAAGDNAALMQALKLLPASRVGALLLSVVQGNADLHIGGCA